MNESVFDRFASAVASQVARPWFFTLCVAMVVLWAPSYFVFGSIDTWQLVINTATTIITFLAVALLQNTQDRSVRALHHKLDALLEAQADVLDNTDDADGTGRLSERLRMMAGVEMESAA